MFAFYVYPCYINYEIVLIMVACYDFVLNNHDVCLLETFISSPWGTLLTTYIGSCTPSLKP